MSIYKIQKNYPVNLKWIYFPLHPDTPMEGQTLLSYFKGRITSQEQINQLNQQMKVRMDSQGLEYGNPTMIYNTRLAQEIARYADTVSQEISDKLHLKLYKGYFVDNVDISDEEILLKMAIESGLDKKNANDVLYSRSFEDSITNDWSYSMGNHVNSVPTFKMGKMKFSGAQGYEQLKIMVEHELNENK